jgi:predicted dehydrogenase
MDGRELKIGLVGAGKMAQHHATAIMRIPFARLVAVADRDKAATEAMREIAPGVAAYTSLAELLDATQVDIVHICTPPTTHESLARMALEAGIHIYVEKPFVNTSLEARSLLELAQSKGLRVCAGHQLLFEAPARQALGLLPALGELVHIESYFSFRTVRRAPGGRAPLRPDLQLLDILPHPVYLLLEFLEKQPGETVLSALEVGQSGTVHALVRRGNVTGNLTVTLEGRPVESYLRLVGTNGALYADFVRGTVQRHIGPGTSGIDKLFAPYRQSWQTFWGTTRAMANRFLKRQRSYPGLRELFEAFYQSVLRNQPSPISPASIEATAEICERVASVLASQERLSRGSYSELLV